MTTITSTLRDYREALKALEVTSEGGDLHTRAQQIVDELGPQEVRWSATCILCGEDVGHVATIAEAATWLGDPRGVCAACDAKLGRADTPERTS